MTYEKWRTVLRMAADRIEQPGAWCKYSFGLGANGEVNPSHDEAVAMSACLAIWTTALALPKGEKYEALHKAEAAMARITGMNSAQEWNESEGVTQAIAAETLRAAAMVNL